MRVTWICLALALAGCSTASEPYSYPGCGDAGAGDDGNSFDSCSEPTSGVLECARDIIVAKYQGCSQDSDCALIATVGASCVSFCNFAVRADHEGTFRDELLNEEQRFCRLNASSTCNSGLEGEEGCGFDEDGTDVAGCDAGVCVVETVPFDADAGFGF